MDNKKREKELKRLSEVIIESLTHDEEVINFLADLKDRKVIDSSTLLGLALKISDLLEISGNAYAQEKKDYSEVRPKSKPVNELLSAPDEEEKAIVDGKKLTASEIAFEKWAMEKFNEKKWLRKAGIIW